MSEQHYATVEVIGTFDGSNERGSELLELDKDKRFVSVSYSNAKNGGLYLGPLDNQYILEFEFEETA